jgi:hypothetical protein
VLIAFFFHFAVLDTTAVEGEEEEFTEGLEEEEYQG